MRRTLQVAHGGGLAKGQSHERDGGEDSRGASHFEDDVDDKLGTSVDWWVPMPNKCPRGAAGVRAGVRAARAHARALAGLLGRHSAIDAAGRSLRLSSKNRDQF